MIKICFFSSDAASLYKKDVFRVMGLQEDFVIHFRYGIEHLSMDLAALKAAKNKDALIFFTFGNDVSKPPDQRMVTNVPLREATIKDVVDSADTGLVHVYLKLKGFKNCKFEFPNQAFRTPLKMVAELEITDEAPDTWSARIKAIKGQFKNQLFYKIEIHNKNRTDKIPPLYSAEQNETYYKLQDECAYLIDISFYDTTDVHSADSQNLEIGYENKEAIKVNAPQTIEIGARRDNRKYNLHTQSLGSNISFTYLNFRTTRSSTADNLDNDIQLAFRIGKNTGRAISFSIFTVLVAISVGYAKLISDKFDLHGEFSKTLFFHSATALLIALFSIFGLYSLFNKKINE